MKKRYWWSAFVLLLISVSVEAQVSRVKMEGGVGFSSMRGMDLFNEAVHPFYFTVGAEYLDRDWFHLSSNVGVVRKGGKDELVIALDPVEDEVADWSLMGTFLTLNTLFDVKKVSYDGYTFYAGAGPVVNIKVGRSEEISSKLHDVSTGFDFNPVHLGVRCELGVKKDFKRTALGLVASYQTALTSYVKNLSDLRDRTFTLGITLDFMLGAK